MNNDTSTFAQPDGCPTEANDSQAGVEARSGALPADSEALGEVLRLLERADAAIEEGRIHPAHMLVTAARVGLMAVIGAQQAKASPAGNETTQP